jgi:ABC-type uncharacterized transport system YnjBCD substrate-binding protein
MADPTKARPEEPTGDDDDGTGIAELGLVELRLEHRGARVQAVGQPPALAELVRWLSDEPGNFSVDLPAVPPPPPAEPAQR